MYDAEAAMEDAAVEQMVHPDLYEQDIDSAAEDYEARKKPTQLELPLDNPWI